MIKKSSIRPSYAERVVALIKTKTDLSQEIKQFIGFVRQADVDKSDWRIHNIEDDKEYSGSSVNMTLEGITLETIKYKFVCEEIIEEYTISGKEEKRYNLISFEKIK